jgi:hypothetical protein
MDLVSEMIEMLPFWTAAYAMDSAFVSTFWDAGNAPTIRRAQSSRFSF